MMTKNDVAAVVRGVVPAVLKYLNEVRDALTDRVKALEEREPIPGKDGLDGIDGKDGLNGKDGAHGKDGINGKDGKDGINGKDGDRGERGDDGRDGRDGKDGKDGKDGRDGANGRDAAELEFIPSIDFARSYPRGTVACHKNGIWWAKQTTEGEHGWICIIDAPEPYTVERDGDRGIAVTMRFASGKTQQVAFIFPVPLYRGVFEDGRVYEPGDMVTWAGSVWHCNAPTNQKPDLARDAWTLAVKRGRDGKDGSKQP